MIFPCIIFKSYILFSLIHIIKKIKMTHKENLEISRRNVLKIISGTASVSIFPSYLLNHQYFNSSTISKNQGKNIYYAYRSFWPELEMTEKFKNFGVNTRCFFASNTINSIGFEYCKYPLIWEGIGKYNF